VGMNPKSIGEMPAVRPPSEEPISIAENETRLLYQEFLMKPNTRVLDFLFDNYTLVNDFVRLECGEELPTDDNQ
jgi:translation elongation factor EF-Ts